MITEKEYKTAKRVFYISGAMMGLILIMLLRVVYDHYVNSPEEHHVTAILSSFPLFAFLMGQSWGKMQKYKKQDK
ncbi:MAG: hypothetical protein Q4B58_06450 [Bacteroidales bacterium]|nr:hypothetical protein [Bacteroidales bacterium]